MLPPSTIFRSILSRAARVEEGSVRLIAGSGVLAAYCSVFAPAGLLDESATILGLRTLALKEPVTFDAVVPVRSLLQRIDRAQADGFDHRRNADGGQHRDLGGHLAAARRLAADRRSDPRDSRRRRAGRHSGCRRRHPRRNRRADRAPRAYRGLGSPGPRSRASPVRRRFRCVRARVPRRRRRPRLRNRPVDPSLDAARSRPDQTPRVEPPR